MHFYKLLLHNIGGDQQSPVAWLWDNLKLVRLTHLEIDTPNSAELCIVCSPVHTPQFPCHDCRGAKYVSCRGVSVQCVQSSQLVRASRVLNIKLDDHPIWSGPSDVNRRGGNNQTDLCDRTGPHPSLRLSKTTQKSP